MIALECSPGNIGVQNQPTVQDIADNSYVSQFQNLVHDRERRPDVHDRAITQEKIGPTGELAEGRR